MSTLDQLQSKFTIPQIVHFDAGEGGLTRIIVTTGAAEAHIYLQGGHVWHYQPEGQIPVLSANTKSWFEPGKPIRGGVPVCFPWFGQRADDPQAPNHGFARLDPWQVESVTQTGADQVEITLAFFAEHKTQEQWPHKFELRHRVTIGPSLAMELLTRNIDSSPFTYEQALHTYFSVSDVRNVKVHGLENTFYLDKGDVDQPIQQPSTPLTFTSETDRVYINTQATCILEDPGSHRKIVIEKSGSNTTVVWNPWLDKARDMPDFSDDQWTGMLCIETCAAKDDAVTLQPGQEHVLRAHIKTIPS